MREEEWIPTGTLQQGFEKLPRRLESHLLDKGCQIRSIEGAKRDGANAGLLQQFN